MVYLVAKECRLCTSAVTKEPRQIKPQIICFIRKFATNSSKFSAIIVFHTSLISQSERLLVVRTYTGFVELVGEVAILLLTLSGRVLIPMRPTIAFFHVRRRFVGLLNKIYRIKKRFLKSSKQVFFRGKEKPKVISIKCPKTT